jgi:hypothetical protein
VVYVIPQLSREPRFQVKPTKHQTKGVSDNTGNHVLGLFLLPFVPSCRGIPTQTVRYSIDMYVHADVHMSNAKIVNDKEIK